MKRLIVALLCFIFSFLFCISTANAEEQKSSGKKPISVVIGYFDATSVSCKWGNHCRDDLNFAEKEYLNYLDECSKGLKSAAETGVNGEKLQADLYNFRSGLQARETLYGTCPGKCLSYDFPVDLRNSSRLMAKSNRVDLLIDIRSVYYGADVVLKGQDLTSKISEELYRQTARYR